MWLGSIPPAPMSSVRPSLSDPCPTYAFRSPSDLLQTVRPSLSDPRQIFTVRSTVRPLLSDLRQIFAVRSPSDLLQSCQTFAVTSPSGWQIPVRLSLSDPRQAVRFPSGRQIPVRLSDPRQTIAVVSIARRCSATTTCRPPMVVAGQEC